MNYNLFENEQFIRIIHPFLPKAANTPHGPHLPIPPRQSTHSADSDNLSIGSAAALRLRLLRVGGDLQPVWRLLHLHREAAGVLH